jgi:hypothetical protein
VEDFHSTYTATSIPSCLGTEADFSELKSTDSTGRSRNLHVDVPAMLRSFPVVITNAEGRALFSAEIELSSNHVVTELSATASTVSFSIDIVASLDVPTGEPIWRGFTPKKLTSHTSARVVHARERRQGYPMQD